MSYDNLSNVSQNVLKFYQQLTGEERRIPFIFEYNNPIMTVFSIRAGSRRISPSIAVFFPAILFLTKIDRDLSGISCTCFGIVFILVLYVFRL
jgi:hypothetical protein